MTYNNFKMMTQMFDPEWLKYAPKILLKQQLSAL